MTQHIKIPDDRIGVLIGEGGETKKEIEEAAEVSIDVDSENGSVRVEKVGDPIKGLKGPEIVKAIGRGFSPESALKLLDDEMMMYDSINIKKATANESEMKEKKGRLIGRDGRTRELMEELTGADVRIYGKTFGVIGSPEQVEIVMTAAEMLLDGAPHGTAYSYMEGKRQELRQSEMEYYER